MLTPGIRYAVILILVTFSFRAGFATEQFSRFHTDKSGIAAILNQSDPNSEYISIGDMVFKTRDLKNFYEDEAAIGVHNRIWTDGRVYYSFAPDISQFTRDQFNRAFREWESGTPLQFIEQTTQENYIYIINSEVTSSGVGMGGGRQLLKITPYWHTPYGTVLHEIGHAIGLHHEHQRTDRDKYVEIIEENLNDLGESQILLIIPSINYTPYDFLSIMHYGRFTLSGNGGETIRVRPEYSLFINKIGNRDRLSVLDFEGIRKLYNLMPALIYPENGELNVSVNSSSFIWSGFPDVSEYRVQVSRDSLFTIIEKDLTVPAEVTSSDIMEKQEVNISGLESNTRYYWRARCKISGVYKTWSDTVSFRTKINDYTTYSEGVAVQPFLLQNYPNPFNAKTTIKFSIDAPVYVSLRIFDTSGQQVSSLLSGNLLSGTYRVEWNSNNLATGLYYYQLQAGDQVTTKKMILTK